MILIFEDTKISKIFDSIVNVYSSDVSITSNEIIKFLENILDNKKNKKISIIWDNSIIYTSNAVKEFIEQHENDLFTLNIPPYSPMLNPQENMWNKLKTSFYEYKARSSISEIKDFITDYLILQIPIKFRPNLLLIVGLIINNLIYELVYLYSFYVF